MTKNNILVFNCGSSSIKFTIINEKTFENEVSGIVEALNTGKPFITIKHKNNKLLDKVVLSNDGYEFAMQEIFTELHKIANVFNSIKAVGHRVVHGGEYFKSSVEIKHREIEIIKECQDLAPLHNPANLQGILEAQKELADLKHVACFDTAFHQTMPEYAYIYPLPYSWYKEQKVRKYGFHGMSHKYVSIEAAKFLNKDLADTNFISLHLGNGCSATAIKNGQSVDSTMGFTPLEGLMMGTRSGNIDPSIIFYMSDKLEIPPDDVLRILNKNSGLLGVSELNMDMRVLEEEAGKGHQQAALALEIFCYILAKQTAALAVPLAKLDGIIFTGGIGENSELIRSKTIDLLTILNLKLDNNLNTNLARGSAGNIAENNTTPILVIPTNEELMIAKEVLALI